MPTRKKKYRKGEVRLELGERASYRFSILSTRQVSRMASIYLNKFGLTGNTWRVLSIIGYYGPMSATDVCRHGSLEADKVTRAVDILTRKGYVIRRQNREDRRKVVLSLSARGRRVYDELERMRYPLEQDLMGVLGGDELDALYAILDKLETRAEEILARKDSGVAQPAGETGSAGGAGTPARGAAAAARRRTTKARRDAAK